MKLQTLIKGSLAALVAVVSLCFATSTGHAQSDGDLVINFRSTTGQGSTFDYEVDLGPFSQFISGGSFATGAPISLNSLVSFTDLASTNSGGGFGASWDGDGDVLWSVAGATSSKVGSTLAQTLFGSVNDGIAPIGKSASLQGTPQANINQEVENIFDAGTTANSSAAAFDAISDGNSYNVNSGASTPFFGFFNGDFETVANGTTTEALYEVAPNSTNTAGKNLGTFTLTNTGLTFQSAAAVPEPSTWAGMVLGAIVLVGFSRRRKLA